MLFGGDSGYSSVTVLLDLCAILWIYHLSCFKYQMLEQEVTWHKKQVAWMLCFFFLSLSLCLSFFCCHRVAGEQCRQCPAVTAPTWTVWGRSPKRNLFRNPMWDPTLLTLSTVLLITCHSLKNVVIAHLIWFHQAFCFCFIFLFYIF